MQGWTTSRRRLGTIVCLGLLGGAAALWLAPDDDEAAADLAVPVKTALRERPSQPAAQAARPDQAARPRAAASRGAGTVPQVEAPDLVAVDQVRSQPADERAMARMFGAHSWKPPAPKPPPPPPPPPPRAPPLGYTYFGALQDDAGLTGFFLQGQRVVSVRAGQMLGSFRVDSIDPRQALLTYVPLGQTLTVTLGANPSPTR